MRESRSVALTPAERQQRRRAKLLDLAALDPEAIAARIFDSVPPEKAERVVAALNRRIGGDAETIATRLLAGVGTEMARDVAMALQRHLLQGGSWPSWAPRILS
jgi:hypothetical protein